MNEQTEKQLKIFQQNAALVAVVGVALCALGYWSSRERFFEAYLFAFLWVIGLGLGSLAFVMLHHLVGGRWGTIARRVLEAVAWPLIFAPLLAIPLLFAVDQLYPWANSTAQQIDPVLAKKAAYLNKEFFYQRALGYFIVWVSLVVVLGWLARSNTGRLGQYNSRQRLLTGTSAIGLVLYVFTMSFASFDWMMSLEPHWFSAAYGVIVIAGQCAAALSVGIVTTCVLRQAPAIRSAVPSNVLRDLGNLLFTSITFWIYVSFAQFLIIWSGNILEEIPWYIARSMGGWQWVALFLVLAHFAIPFIALLSIVVKREARYLMIVAVVVCIAHIVDVYWLVMPAFRTTVSVHWLDPVIVMTLGAAWKSLSIWRLRTTPWETYAEALGDQQHVKFATAISHE
jgi:hypothetical protein